MSVHLNWDHRHPQSNHTETGKSAANEKKTRAKDLLKFAGKWAGDDLEKCLEEVYNTRAETSF